MARRLQAGHAAGARRRTGDSDLRDAEAASAGGVDRFASRNGIGEVHGGPLLGGHRRAVRGLSAPVWVTGACAGMIRASFRRQRFLISLFGVIHNCPMSAFRRGSAEPTLCRLYANCGHLPLVGQPWQPRQHKNWQRPGRCAQRTQSDRW